MTVDVPGADERLEERRRIDEALRATCRALVSWIVSSSVGRDNPARRRLDLEGHDIAKVLKFLDVGRIGAITEQEARRALGTDHTLAFTTMVRMAARIRNAWAHNNDREIARLGGSSGCIRELARLCEEVGARPPIDRHSTTAVHPPQPAPVFGAVSRIPGLGRPALVVDRSGHGDHRTIGEAIRASVVPGTLITVKPGAYREALVIDRDVEIVGEGDRAQVVVEATDATAVTVTADRAAVRNLTVRAVGTKANLGAVRVQRGRVVIEGCDLTSAIGSVVSITGKDSAPVIRDCGIRDGKSFGVWVRGQGQGTIERCVISGNAGTGVWISKGGNPVVRDCGIRDGKSTGVFVWDQGQGTIEKCVISGNAWAGVAIKTGGNPVVRDCEIRDGKQVGVQVWEQGQGTFTGNTLTGNARGAWNIEATAGTVTRTGNRPNG